MIVITPQQVRDASKGFRPFGLVPAAPTRAGITSHPSQCSLQSCC